MNPARMANARAADLASRLSRVRHAGEFAVLDSADVFSRQAHACDHATRARQHCEREEGDSRPYSGPSVVRGDRGHCHLPPGRASRRARHHSPVSAPKRRGVSRNAPLAPNADPAPSRRSRCQRADLMSSIRVGNASGRPALCRVPERGALPRSGRCRSLRNALKIALSFQVRRDTNRENRCRMNADGAVKKLDERPTSNRAHINGGGLPCQCRAATAAALRATETGNRIAVQKTPNDAACSPSNSKAEPKADMHADLPWRPDARPRACADARFGEAGRARHGLRHMP